MCSLEQNGMTHSGQLNVDDGYEQGEWTRPTLGLHRWLGVAKWAQTSGCGWVDVTRWKQMNGRSWVSAEQLTLANWAHTSGCNQVGTDDSLQMIWSSQMGTAGWVHWVGAAGPVWNKLHQPTGRGDNSAPHQLFASLDSSQAWSWVPFHPTPVLQPQRERNSWSLMEPAQEPNGGWSTIPKTSSPLPSSSSILTKGRFRLIWISRAIMFYIFPQGDKVSSSADLAIYNCGSEELSFLHNPPMKGRSSPRPEKLLLLPFTRAVGPRPSSSRTPLPPSWIFCLFGSCRGISTVYKVFPSIYSELWVYLHLRQYILFPRILTFFI